MRKKPLNLLITLLMCFMVAQVSASSYVELETETIGQASDGINNELNYYGSIQRFTDTTVKNFIFENGDSSFAILQNENNNVIISTYDKQTNELISTKKIPYELPKFGGFYEGATYNYIVFGQDNPSYDDSVEVIRVVKYDKDFNKISHASVSNCFTYVPFNAGTVSMAENNNELVIHTARKRYLTSDGKNHQSQLTIIIDTETMTVKNDLGEFQQNHVSHSFFQFALYDGKDFVLAEVGDGSPRGVVLNKLNDLFDSKVLFAIPGEWGANCTGVTIGGFEQSANNYFVSINSIDHSKVSVFTSFEMIGLDKDERDVIILVQDKKLEKETKQVRLTNYINNNKSGSAPYIVKISDEKFVILWYEFALDDQGYALDGVLKCTTIDGDGNQLTGIKTFENLTLSKECKPTVIDNKITWHVDYHKRVWQDGTLIGFEYYKKLYSIDTADTAISVELDGRKLVFDQDPLCIDGRTLVPLRTIFEELGADVGWDGNTQTITATKNDTIVVLTLNDTTAYKNGQAITLDVPAKAIDGRTLVPVRFVSDCFDVDVDWNGDSQSVILTSR